MKHFIFLVAFHLFVYLAYANETYVTIRGELIDAYSGKKLENVLVQLPELHAQTHTNAVGEFEIKVPSDSYNVMFVLANYQNVQLEIPLCRDMNVSYELKPKAYIPQTANNSDNSAVRASSAMDCFMDLLKYVFLHKLWM
jgi:hypothetical protein